MKFLKLFDVASILSGYAFKSSNFDKKRGVDLIRIRDLSKELTKTKYRGVYDEKYLVTNGDYLIGMDGEFQIYEWAGGQALLNQRVCKIHNFDKKFLPKFIFYILRYQLKRIENITPYVTVKHISTKQIFEIKIPDISIQKQEQIVNTLDKTHYLEKLCEKYVELGTELNESLFLKMFGNPITNPNNLPVKKLSEIAKIERGKFTHRPRDDPKFFGGDVPWIQVGEITSADENNLIQNFSNTLNEDGVKISRVFPKNTIVMSIAASIGDVAILNFDSAFPDSIVGITPKNIPTKFLFYQLLFKKIEIDRMAKITTQKNINLEILDDVDVVIPAIDLMKSFVSFVTIREKFLEQINLIRQTNNSLLKSLDGMFLHKSYLSN